MCGILGSSFVESKISFNNALEYLKKRGPDSMGIWSDSFICLGHTRLSIRDLSDSGAQPMFSYDGRYVIIFNGEIYNDSLLREKLEEFKINLNGFSDTELVVNLFAVIGVEAFSLIEGMYAIAIYDSIKNILYLTRDPYGIKPLYVKNNGNSFSFSSEIKALYLLDKSDDPFSNISKDLFDYYGHIPNGRSILSEIYECEPGELIRYDLTSKVSDRKQLHTILDYWRNSFSLNTGVDVFGSLVESISDSFSRHLVSDVPVCLFLSSGLDSATLASVARMKNISLTCITVGFEKYKNTDKDEVPLAIAMAKKYGHDHHFKYYSDDELESLFDDFIVSMDQPTIDGFNTWLACRLARSLGFKVALTGAGADEIFNGYAHLNIIRKIYLFNILFFPFRMFKGKKFLIEFLPYKIKKIILLLIYSQSVSTMLDIYRSFSMSHQIPHNNRPEDSKIWGREFKSSLDIAKFCLYYESTNYLRFRLLRDSDWASMAHGVELRLPFVDKVFLSEVSKNFEAIAKLSKVDLFKKMSTLNLPSELLKRKKSGFNVPFLNKKDVVVSGSYDSRLLYSNRVLTHFFSFFIRK